ncbi:unnamed protein product [Rodentolepis nana]|uniref:Uncharacterized protein n=1 Tax=Rodentolepis nana TaxID=102285 RepID=A0A0R3T0Y4_RODNA|nr:unnamed protein product [Rodentolepis nana]
MRIRLHIRTTMEQEQLLTYSWLQPKSVSLFEAFPLGFKRHQRAYTPHDDPGSGHKPVIASGSWFWSLTSHC